MIYLGVTSETKLIPKQNTAEKISRAMKEQLLINKIFLWAHMCFQCSPLGISAQTHLLRLTY